MKIQSLSIQNFKSISDIKITDIENALILVGKNNTGKTVILDAIRLLTGHLPIQPEFFAIPNRNITIEAKIRYYEDDYLMLHSQALVSHYKRYDLWKKDFLQRLPSLQSDILFIRMTVNPNGTIRYSDGYRKHNPYIQQALPTVYHIDNQRNFKKIQDDIILMQDDAWMSRLRNDKCLFDAGHSCNRCFRCMGVITKKKVSELNVIESARLFEYNLYHLNLNRFLLKVNENFAKNGGRGQEIHYSMGFSPAEVCQVNGYVQNTERETTCDLSRMNTGMRCIYILSLLEAYVAESSRIPCIILMEDPEIFLHPQLQKVTAELLYRLSKKNQIIFSTHSPNMLFNFTEAQIRQIALDDDGYTLAHANVPIDSILDDLGYTANDFMNVNFVFIVEGRQDKTRLPLLLSKYYSEVFDDSGKPIRISIITTNSCTNIKTYANLKYINQLYLKDSFLMIRDSDGKDPASLKGQLCQYYKERDLTDIDRMPRVTPRNVLILKYYSFENYFLNPEIMVQIGVIDSVDSFYNILAEKWAEYLHKIKCADKFVAAIGFEPKTPADFQENIEDFKIYMRGHNLYDIFYGRFRENEQELLRTYIELAPREDFADILNAIDGFVYFENRRQSQ